MHNMSGWKQKRAGGWDRIANKRFKRGQCDYAGEGWRLENGSGRREPFEEAQSVEKSIG